MTEKNTKITVTVVVIVVIIIAVALSLRREIQIEPEPVTPVEKIDQLGFTYDDYLLFIADCNAEIRKANQRGEELAFENIDADYTILDAFWEKVNN